MIRGETAKIKGKGEISPHARFQEAKKKNISRCKTLGRSLAFYFTEAHIDTCLRDSDFSIGERQTRARASVIALPAGNECKCTRASAGKCQRIS